MKISGKSIIMLLIFFVGIIAVRLIQTDSAPIPKKFEETKPVNNFNVSVKQTANQPTYDKYNWPPNATGYVYAEDTGYVWAYTDPNKPRCSELTPQEFPNARWNAQEQFYSEPILNYHRPTAENGSYYGEISAKTGRPKTVSVRGYYRKDGTYVRGHYRSKPR
jgi:hypothetical protein